MRVSVIIPAYNEDENLISCLESLGKQTISDFEVVVVDDGGSDKLKSRIEGLKLPYDFLFLRQDHKGPGAARNLGASKAKGEVLVFVDADMTFDKDFLSSLILPIKKGEAKGTFSKEEFVSNWDNVWARCWNFNEGWEEKKRHPKNYPDFQPVFRAILKSEFKKVGGFTPGGYDDDWSLSKKLGYQAVAAKSAIFYHKNPESLLEIFKHSKWVGKRRYKMGYFGYLVALARCSLPFSLFLGLIKGLKNRELRFLIFKVVYDLGTSLGILEMIITGRKSK